MIDDTLAYKPGQIPPPREPRSAIDDAHDPWNGEWHNDNFHSPTDNSGSDSDVVCSSSRNLNNLLPHGHETMALSSNDGAVMNSQEAVGQYISNQDRPIDTGAGMAAFMDSDSD